MLNFSFIANRCNKNYKRTSLMTWCRLNFINLEMFHSQAAVKDTLNLNTSIVYPVINQVANEIQQNNDRL